MCHCCTIVRSLASMNSNGPSLTFEYLILNRTSIIPKLLILLAERNGTKCTMPYQDNQLIIKTNFTCH